MQQVGSETQQLKATTLKACLSHVFDGRTIGRAIGRSVGCTLGSYDSGRTVIGRIDTRRTDTRRTDIRRIDTRRADIGQLTLDG